MFAERFAENYKFKPFLMKYKDTMDSIAKGMVLGFIFELYLTEIPFYYTPSYLKQTLLGQSTPSFESYMYQDDVTCPVTFSPIHISNHIQTEL